MRRIAPLLATATLAVATLIPTAAAADPACVTVSYRVLGGGTDHGACVPTPLPASSLGVESGNPDLVWVLVRIDYPSPS